MNTCENCKFYRNFYGHGQCFGQKNAPRVEDDDSCENFKAAPFIPLLESTFEGEKTTMDNLTRKCWKTMFGKSMNFIIDLRQVAYSHGLTDDDVTQYLFENMRDLSHIQNWVEMSKNFDFEFPDSDDDINDTLS